MPVAIHCEPVSEPHLPDASFETRWIAASLPLVAPRNDRVCCTSPHTLTHSCHREGAARGDPLVLDKRTALSERVSRDTMDCRVTLFLAMTESVLSSLHFFTHSCHREGVARGDPR